MFIKENVLGIFLKKHQMSFKILKKKNMIADVMIIITLLVTYDLLLNSIIVGVIQNVHCHVGFCLSEVIRAYHGYQSSSFLDNIGGGGGGQPMCKN